MVKKYKKIRLINLFISLFTIVIILIFFEFTLRFFDSHKKFEITEEEIRMKTDSLLALNNLKPNSSMVLDGAYVKINSLGFRDYEYSLKKPENVFRIAILGDSFTFGYGIKINETYPKQLEKMLNKKGGHNYEVLNFGVNGRNTLLEAKFLKEMVLDFEPDLVIVGFFPNDADPGDISNEESCLKNFKGLKEKNNLENLKLYPLILDRFNSIIKKIEIGSNFDNTDYYF